MPRRDRTGPMGLGTITGRGLGLCARLNPTRYGRGFGMGSGLTYRHGFIPGLEDNNISSKPQKELLREQRDILLSRLEVIDEQLENL